MIQKNPACNTNLLFFLLLFFFPYSAPAQESNFSIQFSSEPPPLGLYLSANEYFAIKPTETEIIYQHIAQSGGEGINYFFKKKENGKKGEKIDPNSYFAASDGKTFYISYDGKWYKAKKMDGEYCFYTRLSRTETNVDQPKVQVTTISDGQSSMSMEDWYRMGFSTAERQWLPMERVKKPK
jgi:hypothetical protein